MTFVANGLSKESLFLLVGLESNLIKKRSDALGPEHWVLLRHLFKFVESRLLHKIIHIILPRPNILIRRLDLFQPLLFHHRPAGTLNTIFLILWSLV